PNQCCALNKAIPRRSGRIYMTGMEFIDVELTVSHASTQAFKEAGFGSQYEQIQPRFNNRSEGRGLTRTAIAVKEYRVTFREPIRRHRQLRCLVDPHQCRFRSC